MEVALEFNPEGPLKKLPLIFNQPLAIFLDDRTSAPRVETVIPDGMAVILVI